MALNVLTLILGVTIVVTLMAFKNSELKGKLLYIPYDVKNNKNYAGILGHMLIHADYMHLGFNMLSLYLLGGLFLDFSSPRPDLFDNGLMQTYGELKGQFHFLVLYILGGLFGTLIPYIRNYNNPSYSSLGASGAVSAVIFAAILWNPTMELNLMFIPIGIPAYIFGPVYLLYEYYADKKGNTGIAHDAHIGGAIFGIVYVLIINIDKGKEFLGNFF